MLEVYGTWIPSEEELRVLFDAYAGYDIPSDAESVENAVLGIQRNRGNGNLENSCHPNTDDRQGKSEEDAKLSTAHETTQQLMFVDFGDDDPEYQERQAQWNAESDRRQARNEMFKLQAEFDHLFCSYEEYKRTFRAQVDHVDRTDSLTIFAREWFEAGQNVIPMLRWCEDQYRVAALKAKEMKVVDLSEDQTSLFTSDDGIDAEKYDGEVLNAQNRMDQDLIVHWIRDDWVRDGPGCFRSPEAPPSQDASRVLRNEGLAVLPGVGFGKEEEFQATGRRRVHIDEWDQLRTTTYQRMLVQWYEMQNERWDVPDVRSVAPRADLVGELVCQR
jgi:hypothetical protein